MLSIKMEESDSGNLQTQALSSVSHPTNSPSSTMLPACLQQPKITEKGATNIKAEHQEHKKQEQESEYESHKEEQFYEETVSEGRAGGQGKQSLSYLYMNGESSYSSIRGSRQKQFQQSMVSDDPSLAASNFSPYHKRKKNRKIRTTITRDKLAKMNTIFAEYDEQKKNGKNPKLNLKQIGTQLELGYSTILHKYREFRQAKIVKGGALIASLQKKRKYKKSLFIQNIIQEALAERPFYTAVELSEHIHEKHGKRFSRSIISRHLGEMGFSYKNQKTSTIDSNKQKYKQIRKIYANMVLPMINRGTQFVYIDELACNLANFNRKRNGIHSSQFTEAIQEDFVSVIVAATSDKVLSYEIKQGFFKRSEFCQMVRKALAVISGAKGYEKSYEALMRPIIITDMHKIHLDCEHPTGTSEIFDTLTELGCNRFFLPVGSPQLNPLESIFANLKNRLQRREIRQMNHLTDQMRDHMETIMNEPTQVYFKDVLENLEKSQREENLLPT